MRITAEELKKQLATRGVFATMRDYDGYKPGAVISLRDEKGKEIGRARVLAVFLNTKAFRKALLKYSGFPSLDTWEQKASELHGGSMPKYIILCKLL